MKKPVIKICGNTNFEDARLSLEYGADMLGFIFYDKSPRYTCFNNAADIIHRLKLNFSFISVGVFVNPSKDFVNEVINSADIDILQFHGDETPLFIKSFNKKTIKAFRVKDKADLEKYSIFESSDYILLDAFSRDAFGGTGKSFDWNILSYCTFRDKLILSGGISSSNIKIAVDTVKPFAIDLVSSLEKKPGIKDPEKIKYFFQEIKKIK